MLSAFSQFTMHQHTPLPAFQDSHSRILSSSNPTHTSYHPSRHRIPKGPLRPVPTPLQPAIRAMVRVISPRHRRYQHHSYTGRIFRKLVVCTACVDALLQVIRNHACDIWLASFQRNVVCALVFLVGEVFERFRTRDVDTGDITRVGDDER